MPERRDQILSAALAIADERGLDAVSMRSVAAHVGVSAMALYPHVASKDDLLDGLVGLLLAEMQPDIDAHAADQPAPRLTALAHALRGVARRHPAAFGLLLARPAVTRDAMRVTEAVQRALLDAGVPDAQVPRMERMVSTFVLGFAASEVNGRFSGGTLHPRARRAQFAPGELTAHERLAPYLDQPVDWDAEFVADLEDVGLLIRSLVTDTMHGAG